MLLQHGRIRGPHVKLSQSEQQLCAVVRTPVTMSRRHLVESILFSLEEAGHYKPVNGTFLKGDAHSGNHIRQT